MDNSFVEESFVDFLCSLAAVFAAAAVVVVAAAVVGCPAGIAGFDLMTVHTTGSKTNKSTFNNGTDVHKKMNTKNKAVIFF